MATIITVNNASFSAHLNTVAQNDLLRLPFGSTLDQAYQQEYWTNRIFIDRSFIVLQDKCPMMAMILSEYEFQGTRHFSCYGRPATLLINSATPTELLKSAGKALRKHLCQLIFDAKDCVLEFEDRLYSGSLNTVSDIALSYGYVSKPGYYKQLNLKNEISLLRAQLRDSYRSLINWGNKNLNIVLKDKENLTQQDIELFRQLHINEAGKETRSQKTWLIQQNQVLKNEAFLIFGYYGNELVTAALFLYSQRYCYYGVSASKRDMFDKPLGHALIWRAIEHARELGCHFFEMGDVLYSEEGMPVDKKLLNISTFKRGFGGEIKVKISIEKQG